MSAGTANRRTQRRTTTMKHCTTILALAIAAAHQVAGDQHEWLRGPGIAAHRLGFTLWPQAGGLPLQCLAGVDGPVKGELLSQFPLPLLEYRSGCHHQIAAGPAAQPGLPQQQASLDRFAQTHLIGDQQPWWPVLPEPLKSALLVGPGGDRTGGLAHPFTSGKTAGGGIEHVAPDDAAPFVEVGRWNGNGFDGEDAASGSCATKQLLAHGMVRARRMEPVEAYEEIQTMQAIYRLLADEPERPDQPDGLARIVADARSLLAARLGPADAGG